MKALAAALFLCAFGGGLLAGEAAPAFAKKPGAKKEGGQTAIEFAAAAPTDCAVYVLDAGGKVVRHLAAGVLGKNAPAPLEKGSLAQKLVWDGRDDRGRPAAGGPFKVRVGLGLEPEFERMIGSNPADIFFNYPYPVRCLATGPGGTVYVFHVCGGLHPMDGSTMVAAFSREGKYLRQVIPYPANMPEEKLRGLKRLELGKGVKVPFIYQSETRSLVPGLGDLHQSGAVVTSDGRLAFVGCLELGTYQRPGRLQLVTVGTDGSAPRNVLGPVLCKSGKFLGCLALSADEKTLYATGVVAGYKKPRHAVYRFGWRDKEAKVFAGEPEKPGSDEEHLNSPRSVALDKDGNVYVADTGNNRIVVLKPDGSFLGKLEVENPERVRVHPKTGALYVLGGKAIDKLRKYTSWREAKPVAEATLPCFRHRDYEVSLVLDDSAEPPVLWMGSWQGRYARYVLMRIEDKGRSFGTQVDVGKKGYEERPSVGPVMNLSFNHRNSTLLINGRSWNPETGKLGGRIRLRGVSGAALDGNYYAYAWPRNLYRYGPNLKPLPFAVTQDSKGGLVSPLKGDCRLRARGATADLQGNVYVLWEKRDKSELSPGDAVNSNALYVYGPDGKLRQEKLIDSSLRFVSSVKIDYAGNIYMVVPARPGTSVIPEGFEGKIPAGPKDPETVRGINYYPLIYGGLAKFGPRGGQIRPGAGGIKCVFGHGKPIDVKGAEWVVPVVSLTPSMKAGSHHLCGCESPVFDVDGFGRCFVPDAARFRVWVLDTAGNRVCWFGRYGNIDSEGPGSRIPTPEIPFTWPQAVAAGGGRAYVGDRLSRRVVAVSLSYAAEETCALR